MRVHGYILTKSPDPQPEWPSGVPPGTANPGSVFELWVPIQGASLGDAPMVCFGLFFLWSWLA